jgi:hypothetical protein
MTTIKGIEYEQFFENYTAREMYDQHTFNEFLVWFMQSDNPQAEEMFQKVKVVTP